LPGRHPTAILTSVKRCADRAGLTGRTAFSVMTPQKGIEPTLLFQDHTTFRPERVFRAAIGFTLDIPQLARNVSRFAHIAATFMLGGAR
jgi:hypothetical protein